MSTTAPLKSVQSEVVTFQNSAKDSKAGGGSCFGDSGGGAFLGDAVLGDASYVNSLTCNATGSYQRVDTAYARAFLQSWIDASKYPTPAARGGRGAPSRRRRPPRAPRARGHPGS